MIEKVNLSEKFGLIKEYWDPHIAGRLNGQDVRLAKLLGEFEWHSHANEDEMFLVIEGHLQIELRDKVVDLHPGEFIIIPKGTEHKPVASQEVKVLLFEPSSTINTGETENHFTKTTLKTFL